MDSSVYTSSDYEENDACGAFVLRGSRKFLYGHERASPRPTIPAPTAVTAPTVPTLDAPVQSLVKTLNKPSLSPPSSVDSTSHGASARELFVAAPVAPTTTTTTVTRGELICDAIERWFVDFDAAWGERRLIHGSSALPSLTLVGAEGDKSAPHEFMQEIEHGIKDRGLDAVQVLEDRGRINRLCIRMRDGQAFPRAVVVVAYDAYFEARERFPLRCGEHVVFC